MWPTLINEIFPPYESPLSCKCIKVSFLPSLRSFHTAFASPPPSCLSIMPIQHGPLDRLPTRTPPVSSSSSTSDEILPAPEPATPPIIQPQPSQISTRTRKHCNTLSERYRVIKWMLQEAETAGPTHIISKGVRQFPRLFSGTQKAKLQKVSNWWKSRDKIMALKRQKRRLGAFSTTCNVRRKDFKALPGRGRRRAVWVKALYADLLTEVERLSSAGVKFSPALLQTHAKHMIATADASSEYNANTEYCGVPIGQKVTIRWVQHFMQLHGIASSRSKA